MRANSESGTWHYGLMARWLAEFNYHPYPTGDESISVLAHKPA